jgi:hypothetical protein
MEVGEVGIGLKFAHVNVNLVHGMSSIDEERNVLFFKELNQRVNRSNEARDRNYMVKDCQFYFFGVAVDKIFHLHLIGLMRLHIGMSERELNKFMLTFRMVML